MFTDADLHEHPNALAAHYTRFCVADRLLLTGHSHQAWPDRALEGHQAAWLDAAECVDEKWDRAFERADRVRRGYAALLGAEPAEIALGQSTHELLVRFLSALPLRDRPRLVTTTGEFHTARRQLDRLAEEGIEVVKVRASPADDVAARLAAAVDDGTAAVIVSSVFYEDARILRGLDRIAHACRSVDAELVVDAYHQLNVVPFSIRDEGLDDAAIVGGGYKYCQLGEGNAFLRVPPVRDWRPVITGWFAEFGALEDAQAGGPVAYAPAPHLWAGATYDPTSHYRAAEVFDFFREMELTPARLREVSQHQVGLLARAFDALDLDPRVVDRDRSVPLDRIAGFLALRSPIAGRLQAALGERGVRTDHRGHVLRFGPAPYLSDRQLEAAMAALGEAAREAAEAAGG